MLHLFILWLCFLSYVQLGKMDSTIPHPKPHLTLNCFLKILANIPFSVALHVSYFQNVTKLVRDVLIFCYIISQYYLFEFPLIYRFLNFEIFATFVLPLILEGWMPSHPSYVYYLFNFYALYTPLFINQLFLHDGRVIQTIFFLALIEIPSVAYSRSDRNIQEILLKSYVFKIIQLPQDRVAILQCAKNNIHGINQIELAIACVRRSSQQKTLVIMKRTPVNPNTCDLNYNQNCDLLITSSCSELSIFNAKTLQLLKVHQQPRAFKRIQFVQNDSLYASLNKINSSQWLLSVCDSTFNTPFSQHPIRLDSPIELSRCIKYSTQSGRVHKYLYICVPSDRLNCLILVDIHRHEVAEVATENSDNPYDLRLNQERLQLDNEKEQLQQITQTEVPPIDKNTKESNYLNSDVFAEDCEFDSQVEFSWRGYIPKDLFRRFLIRSAPCGDEVNLFQHLKKEEVCDDKIDEGIKEYLIDGSAIKHIFVYQHILVVSCSENIIFFNLRLRCVVKKISTLCFDMRVHWIGVTEQYTYYLFSNEIKAWMGRQNNETHTLDVLQHYNLYGIQSVLENNDKTTLHIIYNSQFNQKVAILDISSFQLK